MKPFFKRRGSKWRAAPRYPAPLYPLVIEPFAGSAGYSLDHEPTEVWLNDLDKEVFLRWQYLQSATQEDILALPIMKAKERISSYALPDGAAALLRGWSDSAGSSDVVQSCDCDNNEIQNKYPEYLTAFVGRDGKRHIRAPQWLRMRERVATQLDGIRHWRATNLDYRELPDIEATWFIDPPYQPKHMRNMYEHGRNLDYGELAEWCKSRRGQVIVCEASGSDWLPFEPLYQNGGVGAYNPDGSKRITTECVWVK